MLDAGYRATSIQPSSRAEEDVLDVYQRPRDPLRPLVTLDEASKQLVADVTPPAPLRPGRPTRQDYEYERRGTANLFMLFAPLEGGRHVKVTDRRTILDFARVLRDLSDVHFEVHHTPKHASWLNMAECELSVLGRQCLAYRIDSQELLTTEVAAWQEPRNTTQVPVDWQFRTPDARIKLKRLYPALAPAN